MTSTYCNWGGFNFSLNVDLKRNCNLKISKRLGCICIFIRINMYGIFVLGANIHMYNTNGHPVLLYVIITLHVYITIKLAKNLQSITQDCFHNT